MKKLHFGFTLIEMLVVCAIIAVVAAILFPVLASAKKAALKADSTSNLRQCVMALNLYVDDNMNGMGLPSRDTALRIIPPALTCDKADYWRTSCKQDWFPLVGSYGYFASDPFIQGLLSRKTITSDTAVFVSIFYSSPRISPFHGWIAMPSNYEACHGNCNFETPDSILVARWDGSVKWQRTYGPKGGLSWQSIWSNLYSDTKWVYFHG